MELTRFGNVTDTHGNPDWVNEGWTGTAIKDFTTEGGTAIDIGTGDIGTQLDSRSKGSLWDDDPDEW